VPNDDDIRPPEVARATTPPVAVPADLRGAHRFVLRELRIENGRVTRLLSGVDAWRQSAEVRAYVAVLEESSAGLGADERKYTAEWCAWAMDWADRSDPSRHVIVTTGRDGEKR
jgi:hypothetical protein